MHLISFYTCYEMTTASQISKYIFTTFQEVIQCKEYFKDKTFRERPREEVFDAKHSVHSIERTRLGAQSECTHRIRPLQLDVLHYSRSKKKFAFFPFHFFLSFPFILRLFENAKATLMAILGLQKNCHYYFFESFPFFFQTLADFCF